MQPLAPIYTSDLFGPLHAELLLLLRRLGPEEWERPTAAPRWRVRDVAAHLLDGDLRVLSALRDGHGEPPAEPIDGYDDLVRFLDRLNADWVTASRRLSPRVLTELLATTGPDVAATFASLPPHAPALYAVAWAGETASENWMHVGREYTERWHHQMQIRDAIGAPGLFARRWLYPLLDLSVRALPYAYRATKAGIGMSVVVEVEGPGGGVWSLVKGEVTWAVYHDAAPSPEAAIRLDADTAWKSLYHALVPSEARARAHVEGDEALAAPFFGTRSVMVATASAA